MTRSLDARLHDIIDAITGIRQTLAGKNYAEFSSTWHLQKAIERGLEIISEASRHIPEEIKIAHPEVPWRQIAGIGNILRHDYQRVEPLIVWNIIDAHLDALEATVRSIGST